MAPVNSPANPLLASSGLVTVPAIITPLIAGKRLRGPLSVQAQNEGLDFASIEVAFSWNGVLYVIWPTTAFDGPDGNGLPPAAAYSVMLPDQRAPFVRIRGKAQATTTDIQIDIFSLDSLKFPSVGQFLPQGY